MSDAGSTVRGYGGYQLICLLRSRGNTASVQAVLLPAVAAGI